jgi:LysM repeat protein
MTKRLVLIVALLLIGVLSLSACVVSKSNVPQATPTNSSPARTPTGMGVIQSIGTSTVIFGQTQTAMAVTPFYNLPTQTVPGSLFTQIPLTGQPTALATSALTPIIIVPTATPGRPLTYTIEQGEYPYCLARRFNLNPQDLLDLNHITDSTNLQAGTVLQIPQTGTYPGTRALHPHPATYTVTASDTIYKVACYFGDVDPSSIALANGLTSPYLLTAGRVLNIP